MRRCCRSISTGRRAAARGVRHRRCRRSHPRRMAHRRAPGAALAVTPARDLKPTAPPLTAFAAAALAERHSLSARPSLHRAHAPGVQARA
eukprot:4920554-Prymnesium_polylepis.1